MQWFYRDGSPVEEKDVARIKPTRRDDTGYIVRRGPCSRCGGQGGSEAWKYTGYTCYRCGGRDSMVFERYESKVYHAERLAYLNEIAEKKAAKKRAEAARKAEKKRQEFIAWAKAGGRDRGELIGRILRMGDPYKVGFVHDLAGKLRRRWTLTERQLEAAASMFERIEQRKKQDAESEHVGSVKERIEFEGVVEFETVRDSYYGVTHILKFRADNGNVFTWFASDYQSLKKGDRVRVVGTVKKHDTYRGVKQTVLTRCKVTKFAVVSAEEAAKGDLNGPRVRLIYPERRIVPGSLILLWHSDAVANGDIQEHTSDLATAIANLSDIGHITVARD